MQVSLIAAVANNGTIGKHNDLPWRIKDDMRFFRQTTRGHTVITGRKNYEAMGRALPHRVNLVVTRQTDFAVPDATRCSSLEEALRIARNNGETEAFVIGGAELYSLALPYAHTFYRTRVLADVDGDVHFPSWNAAEWKSVELARYPKNADNEHPCVIEKLSREGHPARF